MKGKKLKLMYLFQLKILDLKLLEVPLKYSKIVNPTWSLKSGHPQKTSLLNFRSILSICWENKPCSWSFRYEVWIWGDFWNVYSLSSHYSHRCMCSVVVLYPRKLSVVPSLIIHLWRIPEINYFVFWFIILKIGSII